MKALADIAFSFPVQLFILHIKKHHFLMLFWVVLLLIVTGNFGSHYGVNYLYLEPEYLGGVSFYSFLLLGAGMGGFMITWNIASYILHARHFPFLATLRRPFGIYVLNNSIIPLFFLCIYIWKMIDFQKTEMLVKTPDLLIYTAALLLGIFIIISISGFYFFQTNKDVFQILGLRKDDPEPEYKMQKEVKERAIPGWRVETYLNMFLRPRLVRGVEHYDPDLIKSVYKQHHTNALFIEISGLGLLIALGLLIDYPLFRIPAASSLLLFFSLLMILTGAFSYWIRGWRALMYILLILSLNYLMRYDLFNHKNKAFGMNYESTVSKYSMPRLQELSSTENIEEDRRQMQLLLNNWNAKVLQATDSDADVKPKMVILNSSGGGLRSALFSMTVLQIADSLTDGALSRQTFLMTGASGGMFGLAYWRELCWTQNQHSGIDKYGDQVLKNISRDVLNPVMFTVVVNDLFFPWQKFNKGGHTYRKDRGYIFEEVINQNTDYMLDKPISAYRHAESTGEIPLLILSPTIINDDRKCYISTQGVSFLTRPYPGSLLGQPFEDNSFPGSNYNVDGIDFGKFFIEQDADSLRLISALRMNATFPYILPNVFLPSDPVTEVMDAGIRDNQGLETSVRFMHHFSSWIRQNTSGVILLQMRGDPSLEPIRDHKRQGFIQKLFNPVGNLYSNWTEIQDYQQSFLVGYARQWLDGQMHNLVFELSPNEEREETSMSFRLTKREYQDILDAVHDPHNKTQMDQLLELLGKEQTVSELQSH